MTEDSINILADKWLKGTISRPELEELEAWYATFDNLEQDINSDLDETAFGAAMFNAIAHRAKINADKKVRNLWPRIIGAAAAVAAIVFGVWFYTSRHLEGSAGDPSLRSGQAFDLYTNDIAPGGNKATIKFGDGEAITLSDKQTGVIVGDDLKYNDNTFVIQSGPLSSRANGLSSRANAKDPSKLGMTKGAGMTITTPRGGTYQITLPDGTKVWLNAASVLTYTMPLNERGGVREVKLSGEAYFEVFRNKIQPFVVTTKNLTTTVLGTHFNISAYDDENSTKATLLEGSVRVSSSDLSTTSSRGKRSGEGSNVTLSPNQQALVTGSTGIKVRKVDTEEAIAWKSGYFKFNATPLEVIMRQVERWYNIDVVYEDNAFKTMVFEGAVSRFDHVSRILKVLENTGAVKFKIAGRKVIVGKQ